MKYDVVIVGAGPAGIFTAIEMVRNKTDKKIIIIEKGASVENRSCPKSKTHVCMNCKPYCHITTGFSGAGAFSDGKLSLSSEVGGNLPELIGEQKAQETINYTDKIYLEFGADTHIEGISDPDKIREIRKKAIQANLKLVDCPIRHLGTEMAQQLYLRIEKYLIENGVDILFNKNCDDIIIEDGVCKGVVISDSKDGRNSETIYGSEIVVATGRKGADWLEKICQTHDIEHRPGTVDVGVRVEVRNEI
ncbi:MAG: NAD(P)/FAD-dependent oxidoreductase, partial [Oscillospiraceae bacterium]